MRPMLAALVLAYGLIGMVDAVFASIYVPGHIRNGIYIRPHFVSAPKLEYGVWPDDRRVIQPESGQQRPPLLELAPTTDRDKLGEPS